MMGLVQSILVVVSLARDVKTFDHASCSHKIKEAIHEFVTSNCSKLTLASQKQFNRLKYRDSSVSPNDSQH